MQRLLGRRTYPRNVVVVVDDVVLEEVNKEGTKQPPRIKNNVMERKDAVVTKRQEGATANAPELQSCGLLA